MNKSSSPKFISISIEKLFFRVSSQLLLLKMAEFLWYPTKRSNKIFFQKIGYSFGYKKFIRFDLPHYEIPDHDYIDAQSCGENVNSLCYFTKSKVWTEKDATSSKIGHG